MSAPVKFVTRNRDNYEEKCWVRGLVMAQPIVGTLFLMIRHGRAVGKRVDDMQLC